MKAIVGKIGNEQILALFFLAMLLDAGGGFYVKYIMTFVLVVDILVHIRQFQIKKSELLVFIVMPLFAFGCSVFINHISVKSAVSSLTYNVAIIFMLWLRTKGVSKKEALDNLMRQFYVFAWVVIGSYIFLLCFKLCGYTELGLKIARFVRSRREGLFGYNDFGNMVKFLPVAYWSAAMFLIFAQGLACHYKNKKYIIVIALANFITMTTTNMLLSGIIIVIYLLSGNKKRRKIALRIIGVCIVLSIVIFVVSCMVSGDMRLYVQEFLEVMLSKRGLVIKMGHIRSAMALILKNPIYMLFGMGGNSEFYSMGTNRIQTSMEVSHVECLRRFGIIYTAVFFGYICSTLWRLWKGKYGMVFVGFLLLFIATASNPQLMSPMFLIVLFACRYLTEEQEKGVKKSCNNDR